MNFFGVIILLAMVVLPTLTLELYHALPLQQAIEDDQYDQNDEDNEVLSSEEFSRPQYVMEAVPNDEIDTDSERTGKFYSGDESGSASEFLRTEEARNYYRPYIRYRQISRRATRVPINRRYGFYGGYPAMSGYLSDRDRFPTVA